MTSIAELYALQEVDSALQASRAALSDVEAGIGESDEVGEAKRGAEERASALREAEKQFKESEFEADEQRRKIEPLEQRLYKGAVKNPKELEDLELDIASLKRRRSELEDKAIAAMEALDQAQQASNEAKHHLEDSASSWTDGQADLQGRQAELQKEVAELEKRRDQQLPGLDGSLLRLYNDLLKNHEGRAVVKVEGGACGGCRISLPVNVLQRARAGDSVVQCTNCERILYVS